MYDKEKIIKNLKETREYIRTRGNEIASRKCRMMDYIDNAIALIEELDKTKLDIAHEIIQGSILMYRGRELVQCKNCKYYTEPDSHGDRCSKIHWSKNADWFCADGVAKDINVPNKKGREEMIDREKVIKGLETCISMKYETNEEKECRHEQCPYGRENYKPMNGCFWDLMSDTLALLQEQEEEIQRMKTKTAGANETQLK